MVPNYAHWLTDFRTVYVFALGPFLPMKVIFFDFNGNLAIYGHLAIGPWATNRFFAIFPLKFPLRSKKITFMGRKGPRAKTKTVLKSVSKWEQFGSMQNLKFQTFEK